MSISKESSPGEGLPTATERREAAISARQANPTERRHVIQNFENKHIGVDLLALLDAIAKGD